MTTATAPHSCPTCGAPVNNTMQRCMRCGVVLFNAKWIDARRNPQTARDVSLASHVASQEDRRDARAVVHDAILDGLTSRADAQRSLWAIEQSREWRDLESAIAPAIGAPSVPTAGTWVVTAPPRSDNQSPAQSDDAKFKWLAASAALVLIAVLATIAFVSNDEPTPLAQNTASTTSSSTTPTTPTTPGSTTPAPPTPPSSASPTDPAVPPTTPDPNTPLPPTQPAQSAANLARDSERAQRRLDEVVAVINELVQTIDSSVATLDEQPYPRLPGFFDCYPTETDPLPLPNNQSAASYARAHAEFYSSYSAAIEGDLLGTYASLELEDAGFEINDVRADRDYVAMIAQKDGITITIEFENPTTDDPLLGSRFMASALDQCTRVD